MDINSVPQDNSSTYANNKKAIYAADKDGKVKVVGSTGWNAEETVTVQALTDLQESAKEAYLLVQKGEKSPLYYHMYDVRMDLQLLSETTGFFKWTIKRDFEPNIFEKINKKRLSVYADVMGKLIEEIKSMPKDKYE